MKSLVYASLAAVLLAGSPALAQDVTVCGQTVTDGVLTGNLDCSAETGCAVNVLDRGSLDLAGFTITVGDGCGVGCEDDCTVTGGDGTIDALESQSAISSQGHNSRVNVTNVNIVGGNFGIVGARVVLVDSSITLASTAVLALRSLEVRGSEIVDNNTGIASRRHLTVSDTTITGNSTGADAWRKVEALNVTVTDNGYYGLRGKKVHATTTTATGNGGDPLCDPDLSPCADVVSRQNPKLSGVTCETSTKLDKDLNVTAETWGVCSLD